MKRGDLVYLQHVLDAIAKIELYLDDIDQESFVAQSLIQDGVIRQLEIIGEAIKQVSASIRETVLSDLLRTISVSSRSG